MHWSTALESTVLGVPDLACARRYLQHDRNVLNQLVTSL